MDLTFNSCIRHKFHKSMENCLEAKKFVKENMSPPITVVNNNKIYDFYYVDGSIGQSPFWSFKKV